MTHADENYTRNEAAKVFRCSPRTIDRWRAEGKLTAVLGPGRRVLIPAEEIKRSLRPEKKGNNPGKLAHPEPDDGGAARPAHSGDEGDLG